MEEELLNDTVVETNADLTTSLSDEDVARLLELLEEAVFYLQAISEGSATIIVYGVIVAPLLLIITMLWWFFKQFIYKYS